MTSMLLQEHLFLIIFVNYWQLESLSYHVHKVHVCVNLLEDKSLQQYSAQSLLSLHLELNEKSQLYIYIQAVTKSSAEFVDLFERSKIFYQTLTLLYL